MARDRRNWIQRALDDLNSGVRALLGLEAPRPELVGELLDGGGRVAPRAPDRRRRRVGRPSRAHLVVVE